MLFKPGINNIVYYVTGGRMIQGQEQGWRILSTFTVKNVKK